MSWSSDFGIPAARQPGSESAEQACVETAGYKNGDTDSNSAVANLRSLLTRAGIYKTRDEMKVYDIDTSSHNGMGETTRKWVPR